MKQNAEWQNQNTEFINNNGKSIGQTSHVKTKNQIKSIGTSWWIENSLQNFHMKNTHIKNKKKRFENSQMAKYFYLAKFSKGKLPKPLYSSSLLLELFFFCFLASDFFLHQFFVDSASVFCWSLFVFIVISVFWMPSVAVFVCFCLFVCFSIV